ncbi:hypothetical protein ACFQ1Q_01670 [Winogradskyella litorisediminis]|uniref:DUF4394 domain-containing protein n=1 Tax=Winogradskyella litorisediminis TaxID=1156618 RepID=A0ABW3N2K1_9FLAO
MKTTKYIFAIIISIVLLACDSDDGINTNNNQSDGLLVITSDVTQTPSVTFSLDSISKPISSPVVFNTIRTDVQQNFFGVSTKPLNYDAYDSNSNTYFIEFPREQRIYKYDLNAQSRQEFVISGFYSAPIFDNGNLYAITVDNFGSGNNPVNYSIDTINQADGSLSINTSSSFPLLSRFDWNYMSSASNRTGTLYFLSGTNLVSYTINSNTTAHTELSPNFNATTSFEEFYGLEYRRNGNLLAIREQNGVNGVRLELVQLDINNLTSAPLVLYDFISNNNSIDKERYSTTYDAFDDTYCITTSDTSNPNVSFFKEIDLANSTTSSQSIPFYLIGLTSKNNN